jgi:hypothetical protein
MGSLTKSKIIVLNSNYENRNSNGSYTINNSKLGVENIRAITLKSASFKNIEYNVIGSGSRKNNIFYFELDGVLTEVVISEGFYDITDLLNILKLEINNAFVLSGIIPLPILTTLDYNSLTGKITMSVDGGGVATPFQLLGGSYPQSINRLLGQVLDKDLDLLIPDIYQFQEIINLSGLDCVHINSVSLSDNNGFCNKGGIQNQGRNVNLLREIDITVPFGVLQTYQSFDTDAESVIFDNDVDMSEIKIEITDKFGNLLNFGVNPVNLELIAFL